MRAQPRLRSAARLLVRHAIKIVPAGRADWAEAMANELEFIARDDAALMWAAGCVLASYREKLRMTKIVRTSFMLALVTAPLVSSAAGIVPYLRTHDLMRAATEWGWAAAGAFVLLFFFHMMARLATRRRC